MHTHGRAQAEKRPEKIKLILGTETAYKNKQTKTTKKHK